MPRRDYVARENARMRMAYMIWCIKHDLPHLVTTGDNHFLLPLDQIDPAMRQEVPDILRVVDLMLEMITTDIRGYVLDEQHPQEVRKPTDPWIMRLVTELEDAGMNLPEPEMGKIF